MIFTLLDDYSVNGYIGIVFFSQLQKNRVLTQSS